MTAYTEFGKKHQNLQPSHLPACC